MNVSLTTPLIRRGRISNRLKDAEHVLRHGNMGNLKTLLTDHPGILNDLEARGGDSLFLATQSGRPHILKYVLKMGQWREEDLKAVIPKIEALYRKLERECNRFGFTDHLPLAKKALGVLKNTEILFVSNKDGMLRILRSALKNRKVLSSL